LSVRGAVYLVPNLLGVIPAEDVLPMRTLDVARSIEHWLVETPKPARAFLKSIGPRRPLAQMSIVSIVEGNAPSIEAMLAPAREGHDVGILSDAGCPGIADPGAQVVAAAHAEELRVVPLVGPSSLLLALMAAGMNGQRFAFHGYLPVRPDEREAALRRLETESRATQCTQLFIETPYRNAALLAAILLTLAPSTRLCVAADLTLPTESVSTRSVRDWRRVDAQRYAKRPAIFLFSA
jgi:16S rRNA (cytidine1402-2'-O)-methyltransferase